MKISKEEYEKLIRLSEQRQILIREIESRVKANTDYIGIDTVKTIFGLQADATEADGEDYDPWGGEDV